MRMCKVGTVPYVDARHCPVVPSDSKQVLGIGDIHVADEAGDQCSRYGNIVDATAFPHILDNGHPQFSRQ